MRGAVLSKIVCMQPSVDTMLKDPQSPRYSVRRTHRTYSPQFKAELVALCQRPDTSIAAVALQHGMNTNVLHRWLKEHRQGLHRSDGADAGTGLVEQDTAPAFVPIALGVNAPSVNESPTALSAAREAGIRIQCRRAGLCVTVDWPLSATAEFAGVLRELFR